MNLLRHGLTPKMKPLSPKRAALVSAMEGDIRRRKGRLIRVETSAMEAYGPTRGFYSAMQYKEESRFRDFYKPGDDLITLAKRL